MESSGNLRTSAMYRRGESAGTGGAVTLPLARYDDDHAAHATGLTASQQRAQLAQIPALWCWDGWTGGLDSASSYSTVSALTRDRSNPRLCPIRPRSRRGIGESGGCGGEEGRLLRRPAGAQNGN